MGSRVTIERNGAVAIVTLRHAERGNAVDLLMAQDLLETAIACDTDPTIRAVLLNAEGRFFCVGGDIAMFFQSGDALSAMLLKVTAAFHAAVLRLARMRKPLVTAVQGFAAGAGFSIAMLGDIVVAGEAAQMTLAYSGIGLTPDGGASWILPRLIGMRRAQQLLLLNLRLDARAALAEGLLTEVVADDRLQARAVEIALQLAEGPTIAFGKVRELLLSSLSDSFETHLEREARAIADCGQTVDARDAVAAFAAKRAPQFRAV